ncbi:protein containg PilZ domain [Longilinea arvoryzae]|uniref:Protein containg PilZ domain n=1 Tax=Longilinea arvoryzae TaxID=360412 RepID=A0A0S7B5C2_9CHLR|nr:PilZ domain-containing protein [Longilinea arvoryzae]GAP12335.1 protein containg PilZ domain [Longilinea arvoryzae]
MIDRTAVGFINTRRANRIDWDRPVSIVSPVLVSGHSINVSATGILVSLPRDPFLQVGTRVALAIPHMDGHATLTVRGNVVRVEHSPDDVLVAINLA